MAPDPLASRNQAPKWSPDGKFIAFVSDRSGRDEVWVSDPTWDNHRAMFEGAGIAVHGYPYYDAASGGLDFAAMRATIATLPPRSLVLLHACCHNPTGVDLTRAQWEDLIPLLREQVTRTVRHELAHHIGFDELGVRDLGL